MVLLEAGIFLLMIVMAFGFMFFGILTANQKGAGGLGFGAFFLMFSMVLFMGLSIFIGSGYGVHATSTMTADACAGQPGGVCTDSKVIIPEGEDGYWFGFIFMGFSAFDLILLAKAYSGIGGKAAF
jgi:hypothetical protein